MTTALVIGGGIAGSSVAMALEQVGIEALVFEGRPRTDGDAGSYFTVTPNGLDALDAIGALDIARSAGFPTRRNIMVSRTGRTLGRIPLGQPLLDGTPALTMKRSLLARALADEAERRGVRMRHGHRLVSADTGPDQRVVARFENGATANGDLLIGADGVHSRVRRLIDVEAPAGRYVGLTNFGGLTPAGRVHLDIEPEAWRFVFGRRAFFGYHRTPAGDVVWFVNLPRKEISRAERADTGDGQWQDELAALFREDHGPASELIAAGHLELAADNTYDLGRVPVWHRGSMIVIGDALHAPAPSSGQGASLALEDAVLLARALRDADSVEAGFTAFESTRRERVEKIVAYGARSSSSKTPGPVVSVFRDLLLRVVFRVLVTDRSTRWMYGHRVSLDAAA